MKIYQTITYPNGDSSTTHTHTHWLAYEDQVRAGFEKGTLAYAKFELVSGATIEYRPLEES